MPVPPHARNRFPVFTAVAGFVLAAGLVGFAAQPPEEEEATPPKKVEKKQPGEEEGGKTPPAKKRIEVDDPDGPAAKAGNKPDAQLDELVKAAEAAPAPLKEVFTKFAVPSDRLTEAKGGAIRIKPFPVYKTDPRFKGDKAVVVTELDSKGKVRETREVPAAELKQLEHYEELVLAEADKLLKDTSTAGGVSADARAAAAETLLAAALRFHDYARANNLRPGKPWEPIRPALAGKLKDVRLQALRRAVAGGNWPRAQEAGDVLIASYPKDAAVGKEVAEARLAAAEPLMKTGAHADMTRARELLDGLEAAFPEAVDERVKKLRRALTAEATRLYERAKEYNAQGNKVDAGGDLARAALLDPTVPGLRELQQQLGSSNPILYVGARLLPERLSPATARYDSERQAVELIFSGLLDEVPDRDRAGAVRYRPGATQGLPLVVPGGRDLTLRLAPPKSPADGDGFDAADLVATVKLLRARPETWTGYPLPWLYDLPAPQGGAGVRMSFDHGHPDPRALLTFKVLPGRSLLDRKKDADDAEFAAKPTGTGPFRVYRLPDNGAVGPRELVLTNNPAYGSSRDRAGQPILREVHFVETARMPDPLAEFKAGRLHILPDVTPAEVKRVRAGERTEFQGKAKVVTAQVNRRVHILAVNLRRPPLQNKKLRQGLNLAIDREQVLREQFRFAGPENRQYDIGMSGPFPPKSWATPKDKSGLPVPLVNKDLAAKRLTEYLDAPGAVPELKVIYAESDPMAGPAVAAIKAQVEGLFREGGKRLTLTPEPIPARELMKRVEDESRYDLAYLPFEYPDDWYPYGLAAFLDPAAAGRGGRNWTGFLSAQTNPDEQDRILGGELAALLLHKDYTGELLHRAKEIHGLFNEAVPFVPLWHLDRHMIVHSGLKVFLDDSAEPAPPSLLNQSTLFQNVARWRLE
ncbi:MAG: hypothetical protein K2X82_07350 [Gemmataceae bacterium]|nr:hypothetical protein [Gemmataceae bacterium]